MKRIEKIISSIQTILGFLSLLGLSFSFYFLESIRPKMIRFETITAVEESRINIFGITLILLIAFSLVSLYKIVQYLKKVKKISFYDLVLLSLAILSFLFVFGDLALISDIGKQHKHGLAQPEWFVLYPVLGFQFLSSAILTYAGLFRLRKKVKNEPVARDINIYILVQYVGAVCGFLGLSFTILNFGFPRPLWMIKTHITATSIFLLIPYLLVVLFWFIVKIKEKPKQWYDEKQMQEMGRSSLFTLLSSVIVVSFLFVLNFNSLEQLLSVLWFPFYIFLTLFLFCGANLWFSFKD